MTIGVDRVHGVDLPPPQSGKRVAGKESQSAVIPRFSPASDRWPALWESYLAYYRLVDRRSDRLTLTEIGRTSQGRPLVALTISAPNNLDNLGSYLDQQRRLIAPRMSGIRRERTKPSGEGRVVVLITSSSQSGDAGPRVIAELVHHLLTSPSPDITRVLDETVLLIVPTVNPDAYEPDPDKSEAAVSGTEALSADGPAASTAKYRAVLAADDDWDAFTQVETRLIADRLLGPWQPRVWYEIRQAASPHPALDFNRSRVSKSSPLAALLVPPGAALTVTDGSEAQLRHDERTDAAFWMRHHAGIHLLSRFVAPGSVGLRLPEVIDQQVTEALNILRRASAARRDILQCLAELAGSSFRPPPYAYLLPEPEVPETINAAYQRLSHELKKVSGSEKERHDQAEALYGSLIGSAPSESEVSYYYRTEGLDRLLAILKRGGVEVRRASVPFVANGRRWPVGTHFVRLSDQPSGGFARAILEPHRSGTNAAARSLPLLLNVTVIRVDHRFSVQSSPEPTAIVLQERIRENGGIRVGVYRDKASSSDADWTTWMFNQYQFGHEAIGDQKLAEARLGERFDAIIIPDQSPLYSARQAMSGRAGGSSSLFTEGQREAIRHFVAEGGTLVTFNRGSLLAIDWLDLPVRDVRKAGYQSRSGSHRAILRLSVDRRDPLALGAGRESVAWFEDGPAFEIVDPRRARAVALFARTGKLVLDGSIPVPRQLRGRGALVEVKYGRGRVILFAFRPQYQGRSLASYPFLFNALLTSSTP